MKDSFKDWAMGMGVFVIVTFVIFLIGKVINPYNHLSFMECWGSVMLLIVLRSGWIEYTQGVDFDEEEE